MVSVTLSQLIISCLAAGSMGREFSFVLFTFLNPFFDFIGDLRRLLLAVAVLTVPLHTLPTELTVSSIDLLLANDGGAIYWLFIYSYPGILVCLPNMLNPFW